MSVYATALRALAQRRLTESQLWKKLERKGFDDAQIREALARCRADGLLDDRLFARLFVESVTKPLGNSRLVGQLVTRGIDPDIASDSVRSLEISEEQRCADALARALRRKPSAAYASLARSLERYGFPASLIYRILREHARTFGPMSSMQQVGAHSEGECSNDCGGRG